MMSVRDIVKSALAEDIPQGDVTTDSLNLGKTPCRAHVVAKQNLIVSGIEVFNLVFETLDPQVKCHWSVADGDQVPLGQTLVEIIGPKSSVLTGERTALNFLGHLSGIATVTKEYVLKTQGTATKILDTRKTTPLLRQLEKQAVVHGGGQNHRHSLSDAVLIKENHIRSAGSITEAVSRIRKRAKLPIEVEVTDLKELEEALSLSVETVLLDNISLEEMAEAVKIVGKRAKTEASGNMTLDRIRQVAQIGVDYISVGRITHSAQCVDLSLLFFE